MMKRSPVRSGRKAFKQRQEQESRPDPGRGQMLQERKKTDVRVGVGRWLEKKLEEWIRARSGGGPQSHGKEFGVYFSVKRETLRWLQGSN